MKAEDVLKMAGVGVAVAFLVAVSFSAGMWYQQRFVPAEWNVTTVALCDKMEEDPTKYDWKCNDHVVLQINGNRISIHEMPGSVYRSEPVNQGYLGDVN